MTTVLETTSVPGVRLLYRLAVLLAAISGAFCLLFCVLLAINYHGFLFPESRTVPHMETFPTNDPPYRKPGSDSYNRLPTDYQSFLALRHALTQDRQNETLKAQIRQLDLELRGNYFKRRENIHFASFFLFASSILFFAAVRTAAVLNRHIPNPTENISRREKRSSWGFVALVAWLMLFTGLYLGLILVPPLQMEQIFLDKLVAESSMTALPSKDDTPPPTATPAAAAKIVLTGEILAQNWVSFRNFDGNGVGFSDNPPTRWDGKTGENILWKSEVPLPGNSSPVIWGNKLFLTGADEETQKVFCFHIENGELLWTADVTRPEARVGKVMEDTGYAAPTAVADGQHVYAMFANGELIALDFSGNLAWRKSFGIPDNHYGFASSPALYFDRLIVQFDDGEQSESYSRLVALDVTNGDTLWETRREDVHCSWASPTIKKIGDAYQIITCANPFVIAYDPENGEEIWRCKCLQGDVGPSAVSLGNVVLITNEGPRTSAIDAAGSGDITATHVLWTGANATPDTPSPLATEDYCLTLSSGGYLTGYDPKVIDPNRKRARYWELEVGDMANFYSSPLRVGTYIYAFDMTAKNPRAFVIDLSKISVAEDGSLTEESAAAMILSENPMPEPCVTSPAVLNNRLYIRSKTTLYCIGTF